MTAEVINQKGVMDDINPVINKLALLTAGSDDLSKEDLQHNIKEIVKVIESKVPQSYGLNGMVKNDANGYSYKVNSMDRLKRFIVLGSEKGSFSVNDPVVLTNNNIQSLGELLKNGQGLEVVQLLKEFSTSGRTPKPDPIMMCLAACAVFGNDDVQIAVYKELPVICNIPTKLFMFIEECQRIIDRKRVVNKPEPQPTRKRKAGQNPDEPLAKKKVNDQPKKSSGWGRRRRNGVAAFYNDPKKDANNLLYHMTKYKQRKGWSHKLVMRYTHAKITGEQKVEKDLVVTYCTKGYQAFQKKAEKIENVTDSVDEIMNNINVIEVVSKLDPADKNSEQMLVGIYEQYGTTDFDAGTKYENRNKKPFMLVREHLPTGFLRSAKLWEVMLEDMPMTAMLRNLGKMTALGLFDEGQDYNISVVVSKLTLVDMLRKARVHPMKILIAMKTYEHGSGERAANIEVERETKGGKQPSEDEQKAPLRWVANRHILAALDEAFYKSFKQPELKDGFKTNKKFMLALDVSGSMNYNGCIGCDMLTPAVASCAMAMMTWHIEDDCEIYAFGGRLKNIKNTVLKKDMTIMQALSATSKLNFGSTDCALPIVEATKTQEHIDVFIVYTDSDTFVGRIHPSKALVKYRDEVNKDAKLIVCAMQSNGFTIADPDDKGMLDIVGFDSSVPELISNFAKGTF